MCDLIGQAYLMDTDNGSDSRLPHRRDPNEPISRSELNKIGVYCDRFEPENHSSCPRFQQLLIANEYNYQDTIECSPKTLKNYEEKLKSFYEEHIHSDDEARFVLAGSGYFDVRDHRDRWVRIPVTKGDLIILPAGIYHRFTLDENNYIKAMRLFKGEPVWTPLSRSTLSGSHPALMEYRRKLATDSFVSGHAINV